MWLRFGKRDPYNTWPHQVTTGLWVSGGPATYSIIWVPYRYTCVRFVWKSEVTTWEGTASFAGPHALYVVFGVAPDWDWDWERDINIQSSCVAPSPIELRKFRTCLVCVTSGAIQRGLLHRGSQTIVQTVFIFFFCSETTLGFADAIPNIAILSLFVGTWNARNALNVEILFVALNTTHNVTSSSHDTPLIVHVLVHSSGR